MNTFSYVNRINFLTIRQFKDAAKMRKFTQSELRENSV